MSELTEFERVKAAARRLCGRTDPDTPAMYAEHKHLTLSGLGGLIHAYPGDTLRPLWTFYIDAARLALGLPKEGEDRIKFREVSENAGKTHWLVE